MVRLTDESAVDGYFRHGGFRSFLKTAIRHGIEVTLLIPRGTYKLTRLRYAGRSFFVYGWRVPAGRKNIGITNDKTATKTILDDMGIRTPKGVEGCDIDSIIKDVRHRDLRYPLILKPTHGSMSRGVTFGISDEDELRSAFDRFISAHEKYVFKENTCLVEEVFIGREHRVLVFQGRVIACAEKIPATLVGDGTSTVIELAEIFNRGRVEGFELKLDRVAEQSLSENGFDKDSIIPDGRSIRLRSNINMTDGGRAIDRIGEISGSIQDICIRATDALGLEFAGIDIIVDDISSDAGSGNYVVLEANANPYYNMHEKPLMENSETDVSIILLRDIFPELSEIS
jgi:cyanophycin synthetase